MKTQSGGRERPYPALSSAHGHGGTDYDYHDELARDEAELAGASRDLPLEEDLA